MSPCLVSLGPSVRSTPQAITGAFAKRLSPEPVAPLVADGVRYEVPHFGAFHGKEQNGGFVQAWDARKNQLLWDRMIYRIRFDRNLERDVQDVFITEIHLDGKTLFVTNESSERFEMDLRTVATASRTVPQELRTLPLPMWAVASYFRAVHLEFRTPPKSIRMVATSFRTVPDEIRTVAERERTVAESG